MIAAFRKRWVRPAVFVAINTCGLAVVYALVIAPATGILQDRGELIRSQSELLERYQAVVQSEPMVASLIAKAGSEKDEFLAGSNPGAVNANLQARLKNVIQTAGAQLRSVQALPSRTDTSGSFIGAHIELSGSIRSMQAALYAVESSQPYLFVTSGVMTPASAAAQFGNTGEPAVDGQFDIYGAMRGDAGVE